MIGYEFNYSTTTMKDIDALSCNINPLIHQYLVTASIIDCDDIISRPFYVQTSCKSFCIHINSYLLFYLWTFYSPSHSSSFTSEPINIVFIHVPVYYLKFLSLLRKLHGSLSILLFSFWLSLSYLAWYFITYFAFETSTLHFCISSFLPSDSTLKYTTFSNFYYHLNRLHHSLSYNLLSNINEQQISQHRVRFSDYTQPQKIYLNPPVSFINRQKLLRN